MKEVSSINKALNQVIHHLDWENIVEDRKGLLQSLIDFIQSRVNVGLSVDLTFICTHNSRRSHLAQVWASTAAIYFNIPSVHCYSGGTEITAVYPKILETLKDQGFSIGSLTEGGNAKYWLKAGGSCPPMLLFSKEYDHLYNPSSAYGAIMTCSQADEGCPFIPGALKRISISYEDPKVSDGTDLQTQVYSARSLQIAREMFYVFSKIIY